LTVKAHYSNGDEETLSANEYSLSGTLAAGASTITVTCQGKTATFAVTVTAPVYGVTLSQSGTYDFTVAAPGYSAQTPLSVTVTNSGNQATGALTAALSGTHINSVTPSATAIASIAVGGTGTFTVVPKAGLAAGTYTATVTVSGGNSISAAFNVSFQVTTAPVYGISLSQSGTYHFATAAPGYGAHEPLSVTITNSGNQATGALTAALSGTHTNSFTLSATSIASIAAGSTGTFTVVPKTGLAAGTHTAAVTVSGGNGISDSFDVSFTVLQSGSQARFAYYWVNQDGGLAITGDTTVAPNAALTISAQGEGYTGHQWFLNGASTGQAGGAYVFSSAKAGKHTVDLVVMKDGKSYSATITVTVE
jgi:uncharacterized membrane protein